MRFFRKPPPKAADAALFFGSLERQAAEIPDGIDKLRFLRSSLGRQKQRRRFRQAGVASTCVLLAVLLAAGISRARAFRGGARQPSGRASTLGTRGAGKVWLVERNASGSIYSNGLQVRNDFETQAQPRRYRPLSRANLELTEPRDAPAGIVYHTSESLMAPFEPHGNETLKRYGLGLLATARRSRLYNFVIDRFGRVYRVVPEMQAANHAGHSVWADAKYIYVNLNQSFIAVSFEARTGAFEINDAQLHAGQVLTQMLRGVYGIASEDCVTHAQVSVNPSNMNIGYHTDWASHFPFREIGLGEGYETEVPGISIFGFRYDSTFLQAIGGTPWKGLVDAEERIVRDAAAHGMTPEIYRKTLQRKYKDTISGISNMAAAEDTQNGQS